MEYVSARNEFKNRLSLSAEQFGELTSASLESVVAANVLLVNEDVGYGTLLTRALRAVQEVLNIGAVLPLIQFENSDIIGMLFKEFLGCSAVWAVCLGEDDNLVVRNRFCDESPDCRHVGC